MAGTIVADTLQNGSGTNTSTTNVINGSARAWVNFNGGYGNTSGVINASYNVSSITVNGSGDYTVNFTNAMPNANFSSVVGAGYWQQTWGLVHFYLKTTTSIRFVTTDPGANPQNQVMCSVTIFSSG